MCCDSFFTVRELYEGRGGSGSDLPTSVEAASQRLDSSGAYELGVADIRVINHECLRGL